MQIIIRHNDGNTPDFLRQVNHRIKDLRPAYNDIGDIIITSIQRNFDEEGRPDKWDQSQRAKDESGQTLSDTARLRRSFTKEITRSSLRVGTNIKYAGTMHFGAKKGSFGTVTAQVKEHMRRSKKGNDYKVKSHTRQMKLPWGDIPKRPFMLFQEEDWPNIKGSLEDYILMRGIYV